MPGLCRGRGGKTAAARAGDSDRKGALVRGGLIRPRAARAAPGAACGFPCQSPWEHEKPQLWVPDAASRIQYPSDVWGAPKKGTDNYVT